MFSFLGEKEEPSHAFFGAPSTPPGSLRLLSLISGSLFATCSVSSFQQSYSSSTFRSLFFVRSYWPLILIRPSIQPSISCLLHPPFYNIHPLSITRIALPIHPCHPSARTSPIPTSFLLSSISIPYTKISVFERFILYFTAADIITIPFLFLNFLFLFFPIHMLFLSLPSVESRSEACAKFIVD